jgi:hypothetical protein
MGGCVFVELPQKSLGVGKKDLFFPTSLTPRDKPIHPE